LQQMWVQPTLQYCPSIEAEFTDRVQQPENDIKWESDEMGFLWGGEKGDEVLTTSLTKSENSLPAEKLI
jgi:hypothetical protein